MPNPLPDETAASIRDKLSAGRKLDAVRPYREATGAGLAEAAAFVDQLEAGPFLISAAASAEKPTFSLTDHGWLVESPDEGGVRLR
jgi:ribosomal protein L7/L12